MNIWILKASEPTLYDNKISNRRLARYGNLSRYMVERGHTVTWWTDDFDHFKKLHRFGKDTSIKYDNLSIHWLHTPGYKNNISPKRFKDHQLLAQKIEDQSDAVSKPDLILCGMPADTLCVTAVRLGKKYNVPVVLDVRDLWPDVFFERLPSLLHPIVYLLTSQFRKRLSYAFSGCTAIVGNSPYFVNWGLKHSNRSKTKLDKDFPITSPFKQINEKEYEEAEAKWKKIGLNFDDKTLKVVFLGAYSFMYKLKEVLNVSAELKDKNIQFVFCGQGKLNEHINDMATKNNNILNAGWIDFPMIYYLLRNSGVGLCPYADGINFKNNITNKPGEYAAAGLAILSSVHGQLGDMIEDNKCGKVYDNPAQLKSYILEYYENRELLMQHSENSRTMYEKYLNPDIVYNNFVSHLELVSETFNKELS